MLASALTSVHLMKSLLGQGFEIGTASFLIVVFISGLIAYMLVFRESSRAVIIYVASVSAYLILFIFQLLRLIFGPGFASLSILNSTTATILGSWNSFGLYSGVVVLISILALLLLPLSRSMKICYAILALVGAAGVFIVDSPNIWFIVSLILLAFTIFTSIGRPKTGNGFFSSLAKRVAWLPLVLFLIAAVFTWQEGKWSAPVLNKLQAQSSELSLPWQMTLDVVAGSIKNYPRLGVGPNHFSQAYLAYKPAGINQGDGWGIEFDSGFGLIPTFVATQGLIGAVLWIMFFVFLGILGAKVLRRLPNDPRGRFIVSSSFAATVFLWLSAIFFVPSHALLFLTLVMTGVFFGSVASFDLLPSFNLAPSVGTRMYKFMPSLLIICMVISAIWGLVYVKKAVALSDFGMGVKQLTVTGNSASADAYFRKALAIDLSDVYWQARAEAALAQASQLAAGVNAQTPASTTEQVLGQVTTYANSALNYAQNAIAYDPSNYYNYVSEARVSAAAANYRITTAYDNAVKAYNQAIALNQQNPSLYLNLAQLQASQNKLDDALKTIGATLQVKSNYLDAIYLLSQVDAAKGNLPEAITAAQYAITINASSSLLYFQLGTLQYNNKDYKSAADALTKAVQLTPNYSNAQYFLGLAESRLGNNTDAITQFAQLAKANPDNKEVSQILANLQAGKSIFTDTTASTTPNTENRPTLPIKQK
jgi:tetratricopeptide (TPR) repeat protein